MANRVIFMGTPNFAVPALKKLHRAYQVVAVVTQPDRRGGRGRKLIASPVKQAAEAMNLPVLQPKTLRAPEVVEQLRAMTPDVIIVAAFGQILRANVLTLPPRGCLNIHASLLPRWRGAAPIAAAIRAGDTETGITLMKMDEGLDTGPMLAKRAIPITAQDTTASLTETLAHLGAELLAETLPGWLAGNITPTPQDDSLATLAPRIKKEEGLIDWGQSAIEIERHIRAFDPWPGAYTNWQGQPLKVLSAEVSTHAGQGGDSLKPGTVFSSGKAVAVATGQSALILHHIQLAGKRAISAADFINGNPALIGDKLG
jgi:methionyl-tRNA formyltransferase